MRVVIDTSVLVAAARSRQGASHVLLTRLPDPLFQPVISVPLFVEYRAVLLRPENLLTAHPPRPKASSTFCFRPATSRKSSSSGGPVCPTRMTI